MYDNLDPIEAKKVDDSFSYSVKSSFILDQPFITRLERDQLLSEQKIFFEASEIDLQEYDQKNEASKEESKNGSKGEKT